MKAILIIDDIPEEWFKDNLSCTFQLLYYPNGEMKELGISGKHHLKPLPQKKDINIAEKKKGFYEIYTKNYVQGWNECLDEILGEKE